MVWNKSFKPVPAILWVRENFPSKMEENLEILIEEQYVKKIFDQNGRSKA